MAERVVNFSVKVTINNDDVDEITDEMIEDLDLFPYDVYNVGDYQIEQNNGYLED